MTTLTKGCTVVLKDETITKVKKVNEKTVLLENNNICNKNFIKVIY